MNFAMKPGNSPHGIIRFPLSWWLRQLKRNTLVHAYSCIDQAYAILTEGR